MKLKLFIALVVYLCASTSALAQIHLPPSGGGAPAPVCTAAQLAARSGPCSSLTPKGGEVAIVSDSVGGSCVTGGGAIRQPCAYDEVNVLWGRLPGISGPSVATLNMNSQALTNLLSLDFLTDPCTGKTKGVLTTNSAGLVSCAEDQSQAGQATSITIAGLRSSEELGYVIDVNPAEAGTTSAGLQEALARCPGSPPGNCILQLRANTTYTPSARSGWGDSCNFETNDGDNIWIRGAGPSSIVSFSDNGGTNTVRLFCVETGSTNITFSDFTVLKTETCTSSCNQADSSIIADSQAAGPINVERMTLSSTEGITSDTSAAGVYDIWIRGDYTPVPDLAATRIHILDNLILNSARGIQVIDCDYCVISRNTIRANFPVDTTSPPSYSHIAIYEGVGMLVSDNVVDMSRDGDASVTWSGAILLHGDQSVSDAPHVNHGVNVVGNTITGLRDSHQFGIWMDNYADAVINGNALQAGQCSASALRSCQVDNDCEDLGGTCVSSAARGVYFDYAFCGAGNTLCNTGNSFIGNVFNGFQDTGNSCPFNFDIGGGTLDAAAETRNRIAENVMHLNVTNADGMCGDATKIAANSIANNYVVGADALCLAGTQSAGCQLLYTPSTEEITVQELLSTERLGVPHSNTVPGSCTTPGELYHDDDAADGQELYACKAGAYILQSGNGDVTAVGSCVSGGCFQSVTQRQFLASPTGATGQMTTRAIDDLDIPATVCRSDGTNCPAAAGAALNSERFVVAAATSGLSAENVLTPGNSMDIVCTPGNGTSCLVDWDPTELISGFTVGDSSQSSVTIALAPSGGISPYWSATSSGMAFEAFNNLTFHVDDATGVLTFYAPAGDAFTVMPQDSIGANELAPNSVGTSEIVTDGVGAAEIAADAVGSSEIATDAVGAAEIAAGAVGTSEIADGSIAAVDLNATAHIVQVIDRDFTVYTLNGGDEGATTTAVYSFSVPANTIGASGALRCTLHALFTNPTTAGSGLVMRLKFGATTLYQNIAITGTVVSPGLPIAVEFILANLGATNSQNLGGTFISGNPTAPTTGQGYLVGGSSAVMIGSLRGTSAEDTTGAKTLEIAFSIGGTAADNVLLVDSVMLELMP